jgi:hypothetical protein
MNAKKNHFELAELVCRALKQAGIEAQPTGLPGYKGGQTSITLSRENAESLVALVALEVLGK